jgi:hypothetical protein
MSDEQRKGEETEIEETEVEGHRKRAANDEPSDEADDDFEAHSLRME